MTVFLVNFRKMLSLRLYVLQAAVELRPLSMADFKAARKEVMPSMAEDNAVMAELIEWNAKYGEGGKGSSLYNPKLSYYT